MNNTTKWDGKFPATTVCKVMEVGETVIFPLTQKSYNMCNNIYAWSRAVKRKYRTHVDRANDTLVVTRCE